MPNQPAAGFDDVELRGILQKSLYFNRRRRKIRRNLSNLSADAVLEEDGPAAFLLENTGRIVLERSPHV